MDKNSKILLWVLIILTVASISYTFYKTVIKQDFEVVNVEPVSEDDSLDAESDLETDVPEAGGDVGSDSSTTSSSTASTTDAEPAE